MIATLTAPFWACWMKTGPPLKHIRGSVVGNFADHPWAGTAISVGDDQSILKADGKFDLTVPPGRYVVKVCCSERFESIRRGVEVKDGDIDLELQTQPLWEIPGHLIVPEGKPLKRLATIAVRRLYTNSEKTAVVSDDGTFLLRLSTGNWKVRVKDSDPGLALKSISFDLKEVQDQMFTVRNNQKPTLLEITLQ
jgi:hypothetical protein